MCSARVPPRPLDITSTRRAAIGPLRVQHGDIKVLSAKATHRPQSDQGLTLFPAGNVYHGRDTRHIGNA